MHVTPKSIHSCSSNINDIKLELSVFLLDGNPMTMNISYMAHWLDVLFEAMMQNTANFFDSEL